MSKRLSKTGVEYGDYSWNPFPGCLHKPQGKCPVEHCWAEGMWKRQMGAAAKRGIILPDFHHPHLIPELLLAPLSIKKPARILVNFMGDLFGDWVNPSLPIGKTVWLGRAGIGLADSLSLRDAIYQIIRFCPQHTFIFLTKNPFGLIPWSPFPKNCRVGVSVCNQAMYDTAMNYLVFLDSGLTFLSFEPLQGHIEIDRDAAQGWYIIGQETPVKASTSPKISWIEEIEEAAHSAGIAYFEKDNLRLLLNRQLVQDFPQTTFGE